MQTSRISFIAIGAAFVAVLLGYIGYLYFAIDTKEGNAPTSDTTVTVSLSGTVTTIDLSAMAVDGPARITFETEDRVPYTIAIPSMELGLCKAHTAITPPSLIAIGDTVEVVGDRLNDGDIVPCDHESHHVQVTRTHYDEATGIAFTYRIGPNGYMLHTQTNSDGHPQFVHSYQLMLESDMRAQQGATMPTEGAPTIALMVYKNPEKLWPAVWAQKYPSASHANLMIGTESETAVGGAKAVSYIADGLYAMQTYVVTSGAYVYVFTGAYIDETSPTKIDFPGLIESVTFFPPTK